MSTTTTSNDNDSLIDIHQEIENESKDDMNIIHSSDVTIVDVLISQHQRKSLATWPGNLTFREVARDIVRKATRSQNNNITNNNNKNINFNNTVNNNINSVVLTTDASFEDNGTRKEETSSSLKLVGDDGGGGDNDLHPLSARLIVDEIQFGGGRFLFHHNIRRSQQKNNKRRRLTYEQQQQEEEKKEDEESDEDSDEEEEFEYDDEEDNYWEIMDTERCLEWTKLALVVLRHEEGWPAPLSPSSNLFLSDPSVRDGDDEFMSRLIEVLFCEYVPGLTREGLAKLSRAPKGLMGEEVPPTSEEEPLQQQEDESPNQNDRVAEIESDDDDDGEPQHRHSVDSEEEREGDDQAPSATNGDDDVVVDDDDDEEEDDDDQPTKPNSTTGATSPTPSRSPTPTSSTTSTRNKLDKRWDLMFECLVVYKRKYGNTLVPCKYEDKNGVKLGKWVNNQRTIHGRTMKGMRSASALYHRRVKKLDSIGFAWSVRNVNSVGGVTSPKVEEAEREQRQDDDDVDEDNDNNNNNGDVYDSDNEKKPALMMNKNSWGHEAGDGSEDDEATIVADEEDEEAAEGMMATTTSKKRKKRSSGQMWKDDSKWDFMFDRLVAYKMKHGHAVVPTKYKDPDGATLGNWTRHQRTFYSRWRKGLPASIDKRRIDKLNSIGFVWSVLGRKNESESMKAMISRIYSGRKDHARWDAMFDRLVRYKEAYGDTLVAAQFEDDGGVKLGKWVHRQRDHYAMLKKGQKSCIDQHRIDKLDTIGFAWSVVERHTVTPEKAPKVVTKRDPSGWKDDAKWDAMFTRLVKYKKKHGNVLVPTKYEEKDGTKLGGWVRHQRKFYARLRKGMKASIDQRRVDKLESIGFVWCVRNRKPKTMPKQTTEAVPVHRHGEAGRRPKEAVVPEDDDDESTDYKPPMADSDDDVVVPSCYVPEHEMAMFDQFYGIYREVVQTEFRDSGIQPVVAKGEMWRRHKRRHGSTCSSFCACVLDIPYLTSTVVEAQNLADPGWNNMLQLQRGGYPIGLLNSFAKRFVPKLRCRYSREGSGMLLKRLHAMWQVHCRHPNYSLTCSDVCECSDGWDTVFHKGDLMY